ncbi:MAG: peptidylprolyl isomerase [Phycisphaerae bacterium]
MPKRFAILTALMLGAGVGFLPGSAGCRQADPEALQVRAFYEEPASGIGPIDARGANVRDEAGFIRQEGPTFAEQQDAQLRTDAVDTVDATQYIEPEEPRNPGVFFTVGGVIARVNGRPIYTDDVLERIEPVLAARARELDLDDFTNVVRAEVRRELEQRIEGELLFAAAERNLTSREMKMADFMTSRWREQQITQAGGSAEAARRRAREATGMSFEQVLTEQNRVFVTQLYFNNRLVPRVSVTATELRAYYDRNREPQFAKPAQATFRVIRLDAEKHGSLEAALAKADDVVARVRAGHDFGTIAEQENDHPLLRDTAGRLGGAMQKGTFAVPKVDEAVWQLEEGQVTDPITVGQQVYVAWMEDKTPAVNRPFDDPAVQQEIRDTLQRQRFLELREGAVSELRNDAYITRDEEMLETAVDVALQNYQDWRNDG